MKKLLLLSTILLMVFSACSSSDDPNEPSNTNTNTKPVNYSELFSDNLCSTLKAGITENQIKNCSDTTFKRVALEMLKGTYSKDYRIAKFNAYLNPNIQATSNKTSTYSMLDNATGISIAAGSTLKVIMGAANGYTIKLRIQNLYNTSKDGFYTAEEFTLKEGLNTITSQNGGLVYILYFTSALNETAQPINLHFVGATVNGYFDLTKDGGKWKERLNKATNKYFDVLGRYAHLTFETADLKQYAGSNEQLILDFDSISHQEQIFMGLKKYDKMFRNRMYLEVIYLKDYYMYATGYHTAFNKETMPELCTPSTLTTGSCWGPAHEIGHCNQTRPGLKWLGTTEVTNNIMSQYIQTEIFKQPSRIQTENMNNYYRNRYGKAWNSIIVAGSPHSHFQSIGDATDKYSSDVFCKLVPFWQLQLYFGKVLGRTPLQQKDFGGFYPDVYEYYRNNAAMSTAGQQQTEFVYVCSKLSGYNLLDFFTKWGFLTPINISMDDYGSGTMEVTQARIDEIKARVEALNLPKPDVALEYITDATADLYKSKPAVVKGSSARDGNKLTMSGWQNVVAYEVTDASSKLLFISQGINTASTNAWFNLPFNWQDTYKVYAVSASGDRTQVIF